MKLLKKWKRRTKKEKQLERERELNTWGSYGRIWKRLLVCVCVCVCGRGEREGEIIPCVFVWLVCVYTLQHVIWTFLHIISRLNNGSLQFWTFSPILNPFQGKKYCRHNVISWDMKKKMYLLFLLSSFRVVRCCISWTKLTLLKVATLGWSCFCIYRQSSVKTSFKLQVNNFSFYISPKQCTSLSK